MEWESKPDPAEARLPGDGSALKPITRRRLLERGVAAGTALAIPSFFGEFASAATAATPKRGGTLRTAQVGGGASETLKPFASTDFITAARARQLYNTLMKPSTKTAGAFVPELATSLEPNKTGTVWLLKLRSGVTFHNGKQLTADDVLYTWSYILDPANGAEARGQYQVIDMKATKKIDAHTIEIHLSRPFAAMPALLGTLTTPIIPAGTTQFTNPIGTGPFKYESFTPGQQSVFSRNNNYWVTGRPYVDSIQMISIPDTTARLNALLGGQVDIIQNVDFAQAKANEKSSVVNVIRTPGSVVVPFYVRMDRAPFRSNDVRVAMKLAVDRKQMVQNAILGYGSIGNDLFGKGYASYNSSLPQREYDPEQAKSLLKKAGFSKLNVSLYTTDGLPGQLESAQLYAQQAKKAGININLIKVPAANYYDPQYYLKVAFGQTNWAHAFESNAPYAFVRFGAYNETAWKNHSWDHKFFAAQGVLDDKKRNALYKQLQVPLWQQGGYVMWGFQDFVDAASKRVQGITRYPDLPMLYFDFSGIWLS